MENLNLDVNLNVDEAKIKSDTDKVKKDIEGVASTAESSAKKVAENVKKITKNAEIKIDEPKIKAETEKVKKDIESLADSAEASAKKVEAAVSRITESHTDRYARENQELLEKYAKNAREAEALWKSKQGKGTTGTPGATAAPAGNNIKETAEDVKKLAEATEDSNEEQSLADEIIGGLSLETFTLGGAISFATGFLIEHKMEIIKWIFSLLQSTEANAEATKVLKEQLAIKLALRDAMLKGTQAAVDETVSMQTMYAATQNANIPLADRNKIIDEMQKKYPDYFANFKNEELLAGKAEGAYNRLTTAILAAAKARAAQDAISENQDRIIANDFTKADFAAEREEARLKVREAQDAFNRVDKYKDNSASSMTGASAISASSLAAGALQKAKDNLDEIDQKIYDISTDSDILNRKNAKLANDIQNNIVKNGAVALLGIDNTVEKEKKDKTVDERKNLLDQLSKLDKEYSRKSFTKDAEELQALRDKFSKIRDLVNEFNKANPAKAISLIDINNLQGQAESDLRFRQDTEKLKLSLDKQKELYASFENYKKILGETKAKERFKDQLTSEKTYVEQLQAEIEKLDKKDLTGAETERKKALEERLKAETVIAQDIKNKDFADAYVAALSHEEKVSTIRKLYAKKAEALGKAITDDQKKELIRQSDNAIDAANDEAYRKTEVFKKLNRETIILTRAQIKEQIKILGELSSNPSIDPVVKTNLTAQLSGLKTRLNIGSKAGNVDALKAEKQNLEEALSLPHSADELKAIQDRLVGVGRELKKLTGSAKGTDTGLSGFLSSIEGNKGLAEFSKYAGVAADGLNTMSQALGGVETEAGYTLDTVGQLVGAAGDLAGAIVSGDPAQMISAGIKAVGTLFSIGKKVKEMNAAARKEVADYYANAISGEREYQELLKKRALQNVRDSKTVLEGIRAEIALRKSQTADWSKEYQELMAKLQNEQFIQSESYRHGTWFRKAEVIKNMGSLQGKDFEELSSLLAQGKLEGSVKAMVERLKELEEKGYDAKQALADLAKETNELFTGTNAESLTNSLLDMFKNGKTGASDLAEFFKDTMSDAALSVFKNKVLAAGIDKYYEEFAKRAQSDDSVSESESLELNKLFDDFASDSKKKFEELKKATGLDLEKNNNANSLQGAFKSASQDSITILSGYTAGARLAMLEGNAIAKQSAQEQMIEMRSAHITLLEIATNTLRTADNTDNLKDIKAGIALMARAMGSTYNASLSASGTRL